MTESLYHDEMPRIFYDLLAQGLSQKLCAVKLGISESTLKNWVKEGEVEGKSSLYYQMWYQKEMAKADRAIHLMGKLEEAAARRDPGHLRWMLNKCDDEYYDLPTDSSSKNKKPGEIDPEQPQLTDAEVVDMLAKFAGTRAKN